MLVAGFLLYLGACLGHIAILSYSLNWWYAQPLRHRPLFMIRLTHGLLVLVGLVALWPTFGSHFLTAQELAPLGSWRTVADAYTLACLVVGFGVVPLVTLARHLRRQPGVLISNHAQTIDVAAELGYKPVGRGKYHLLARLPRNEIFNVDLVERTLRLPDLPSVWDGLTILHLSDLHLCGTPDRDFYFRVMDRCLEPRPDLVAVTGDVVDSRVHYRWIIPVLGRLKWHIAGLAILGNHDWRYDDKPVRQRLRRLGFHVLGNTWQQIMVRGEPMIVIGQETPWFGSAPDLSSCPEDPFRLCLSHTPDNFPWAQKHHIQLMLSGHTHGGQIRFPVIGSVLVPSAFSRRYDCGTFHEPPTVLHVNRGLSGQPPIRYNCRPEVTRLVLRKQDGGVER